MALATVSIDKIIKVASASSYVYVCRLSTVYKTHKTRRNKLNKHSETGKKITPDEMLQLPTSFTVKSHIESVDS